MLSVTYDDIFSRFLAQVQAYDLLQINEYDAREKLNEWLMSVKSNSRVRKIFTTLAFDKNIETITCELKNSVDDEADNDFVIELFALGVKWRWVTEKYESVLNTSQYFGSGEKKMFSQANHMAELKNMSTMARTEFFRFISDHGYYNNSYLGG